tara:strand:- start:945 stop:1157 length:213 start_codon:yes stop_codon:yes gene_type:complete
MTIHSTTEGANYGSWITEELERLVVHLTFEKQHFAETFTERADLNKEIKIIQDEIRERKKTEPSEAVHTE